MTNPDRHSHSLVRATGVLAILSAVSLLIWMFAFASNADLVSGSVIVILLLVWGAGLLFCARLAIHLRSKE